MTDYVRAKDALLIPDGMQGLSTSKLGAARKVFQALRSHGIAPAVARRMVASAVANRRPVQLPAVPSKPVGYRILPVGSPLPVMIPEGMGDFQQAVVGLIAGGELDQLMRAVRNLNDEVIRGLDDRRAVQSGYKEAKSILDDAVRRFGQPTISVGFGVSAPNVRVLPAYTAMATARKGVEILARQVQTLGMLDRVFTAVSVELTKAGAGNDANAIDSTLAQVRRFVRDTDDMFATTAPEYMDTKRAILASVERKYAAAGMAKNAIGDARWLGLYLQAANEIVPIPQPSAPAEVSQVGLGGLPVLAAIVIWAVAIVAAAIVASQAIARLIPDQNSKAITAREIALEAERTKRARLADLQAKGASQAEIDTAMKSIDASTKDAIGAIPDPESPLGGLLAPLVVVVATAIGAKAAGVI